MQHTRTLAALAVLAALAAPAFADERPPTVSLTGADSWTGPDKKLHFGASFVFGFAAGNQWPDNKPLAIGVAMIPGLIKEVADSRGGSGFSGKDLVWDFLGATAGVYTSHFLIKRQPGGGAMLAYRSKANLL